MQLATTAAGIARVEGDELAVLDVPWPDLGAVLRDQESLMSLAIAPVRERRPVTGAELRAPVLRPGKVWAIGLNYRSHIEETGREQPAEPMVFIKVTSAVVGSGVPVRLPPTAPSKVDFEGEVAVVIGRRATNVDEVAAWTHVAGITACNDLSARDVQYSTNNFGLAKSFDGFCPLGGSLATPDEYADADDVGLITLVNGEQRQAGRSSDLLFDVPYLVSWLSRYTTLEPGDVISTGTPAGVGHPEGRYLGGGDTVEIRVERTLPLVNTLVS
jgi:2-keto-4-pentenoate hydratase/2-oxohepta-3-ene-1,7-dioic acid hydratase in catechol pathway